MPKDPKANKLEFPFDSPEELGAYLPYLITRLSNRWEADQNQVLADASLQGSKMRVLSSLSAFGELTINELSILSVTEQSTTSRTVEQLVTIGLVERQISQTDQRVRTVKLTTEGIQRVRTLAPTINNLYQDLINEVGPGELQTCVKVLSGILSKIKKNQI